ncbi:hypothetical protein HRG_001316 [Hirsutella rhossiliensis]|uniref:Uncharacterized protein n=1 Tax=Hirsutella rhossiliensis TaxID=111463 RepID=A0A9P8SNR4_9HYPO|nr:uncharacterized protein HRG_01316 [Hirsutella rhossiliensis]KAH0968674.1 hypothetical protein HRG_01316 [Hirsutella rhossiliensis]
MTFILTQTSRSPPLTDNLQHFDTNVNLEHYHTDWSTITFNSVRSKHSDKDLHAVLDIMLDKLQLCQRAIGPEIAGESNLRNAVIRACRGTPELNTQWYTDRKYQQNRPPFRNNNSANPKRQPQRKKVCFICGKAGCWSTKHTIEERKQSRMYFLNAHNASDTTPDFAMFLAEFEGHELDETLS